MRVSNSYNFCAQFLFDLNICEGCRDIDSPVLVSVVDRCWCLDRIPVEIVTNRESEM